MIQIKIEKVDILSIRKNPDNPRVMNKQKFRKLIESIKEFPQMLKLRPIVVNSDGLILGGNMRYTACLQLNHKQVYIIKAEDLTDREIQQFIIKDNVGFGDWDWDILANGWDSKELDDWGLDVWQIKDEVYEEDDLMEESNDSDKKEDVTINLSMNYNQYSKLEKDFHDFIKQYPKVICKIQS
jgi:ParB-like chromosome segregation protein Spo0J